MLVDLDDEARATIVAALDLLQRVAMGQWREILEHCPNVTDERGFGALGDALMSLRTSAAKNPFLVHPSASLGIRGADHRAKAACDIWRVLGGGMESRADDRLTDVRARVVDVDRLIDLLVDEAEAEGEIVTNDEAARLAARFRRRLADPDAPTIGRYGEVR